MKAINGHLRAKFDRRDLKVASTGVRTALKKLARKQLRAAEQRMVLREEIRGFFTERALDRAAIETRPFLDGLHQQASDQNTAGADLSHLADRVLVETPVRVIRKSGVATVLVRASCAV